MNRVRKRFLLLSLLMILLLTFTTPASAFDGRSGDTMVITGDEVINDDLYITARTFVMDGIVNGDLIVVGQTLTINGKVDGDVLAIAQNIQVNGTVTGAVRMAGFALLSGEQAVIGRDMIAAGYSFESREGSEIGQDLLFAGSQILLAGDVARHAHVSARAFELRGEVRGSVNAGVGEADSSSARLSPTAFIPQSSIAIPTVDPGLNIRPTAKIDGKLWYRQSRDIDIPEGAVAGEVTRLVPVTGTTTTPQQTTGERVQQWGVNLLRTSITLTLIGLFLLWLFPAFIQGLSMKLRSATLPSLGWGFAAYAGFFLGLLLIIAATIGLGLLFGVVTLGGLARTVVGVGVLSLLALILGFILVTSFVAKIVFGQALGKWLLNRANSPLAEHRFWPMVIGVLITAVGIALFRFPLIPAFVGGVLNFVVILFGLGALWLWGRDRIARRPTAFTG